MARTIHIIGAGLAGLSAALKLSARGESVIVHEATAFAGGRCRSYHDATLGMTIDNGNHLLLSGNHAALDYLRDIGADDRLIGPAHAEFPFVDLASRERWTLRFNDGRLPLWIFDSRRRVPGTGALDYLPLWRLLRPAPGKTVGEVIACDGLVYKRLVEPLLARRAQHRSAAWRGETGVRRHSRDARRRRACVPAADRPRRPRPDTDRPGARHAGAARRRTTPGASTARDALCR